MSTWMDLPTYASQFDALSDLDVPTPRPDQFPENAKSSRSYWIKEYPIDLDQSCVDNPLPEFVDVLIIGSGITGATAAYRISEVQPHLRVALVEARGICTGATGRNGGFIARPECYHVLKAAKTEGAEEAIRLKKLPLLNRDLMVTCIEKLGVAAEVDLRLEGNIMVFGSEQEKENALKDLEFARGQGWEPECYFVEPETVSKDFGFDPEICVHGAMRLDNAGSIYPRKFVNVLIRVALERMSALSIHPTTPVVSVVRTHDKGQLLYEAHTTKGTIKARTVLHATNAYAGNLCPDLHGSKGVFAAKAHLVALRPNVLNCKEQLRQTFGYADCWHYLHQRQDNGPFLYGLADAEILNDFDDSITLPADDPIREKMARFIERVFPKWFRNVNLTEDITHDWTGIQGLTMSGASIVGRPTADSLGEFCSVGHNGEGMGRCFVSAYVATDALLAHLGGKAYDPPNWFPRSFLRNI